MQIRGYKIRLPLDVHARRLGQPRGLHQPRPHHHAAEGPLRQRRSARTTRSTSRPRWRSCEQEARPLDVGGVTVHVPDFMTEIVADVQPAGPAEHRTSTSARGVSVRLSVANYETLGRQRHCGARCAHGETRRRAARRATSRRWPRRPRGKVEIETLDEGRDGADPRATSSRRAVLTVFKERVAPEQRPRRRRRVRGGRRRPHRRGRRRRPTTPRLVEQVPALRDAGRRADRRRRVARGRGRRGRVRARGPAPVEAPQQGRVRHQRHLPRPQLDGRYGTWSIRREILASAMSSC